MRLRGLLALFMAGAALGASAQPAASKAQRNEAVASYRKGEDAMRREAFEQAVSDFRTATRLDPMFAMAFYGLGQAHMSLRQYPEAVGAYEGCRDVFSRLGSLDADERSLIERAREDELRELRDSLQRVNAGKMKGGSPIGLQVQLEDRIRVLESSRQRGNEKNGGVPAEVFLALGSARFRAGQLPEAQSDYEKAVAENPDLGAAHNNLAVLYMLSGRFDEARQAVKKAEKAGVKVSPQFKDDLEKRAKAAGK
jgi:tetratricopeptide (TPR) repeat protein